MLRTILSTATAAACVLRPDIC